MVQKIHGAAYPGIWVEKQVTFVKLVFSQDISSISAVGPVPAGGTVGAQQLYELGSSVPVAAGVVADSSFGVVESALVQALKVLELSATVLGISQLSQTGQVVGQGPTLISAPVPAGSAFQTPIIGTTTLIPPNVVTIPVANTGNFAVGQTVTVVPPTVTAGQPPAYTGGFAPGTKIVAVTQPVAAVPAVVASGPGVTPVVLGSPAVAAVPASITVSAPPTVALAAGTGTNSVLPSIESFTYTGSQVDVMLGYAEGWFSDVNGVIIPLPPAVTTPPTANLALPITNAQAMIISPSPATLGLDSNMSSYPLYPSYPPYPYTYPDFVNKLVSVSPTLITFGMEFSFMDGNMSVGTGANGALEIGPGSTSGAIPPNSPTGTPGYYPVDPYTA